MSGCSCHINPPCSYCVEIYECRGCGKLLYPDDDEPTYIEDEPYCSDCVERLPFDAEEKT